MVHCNIPPTLHVFRALAYPNRHLLQLPLDWRPEPPRVFVAAGQGEPGLVICTGSSTFNLALQEEAQHFPAGVRTTHIGIAAASAPI